MSTYLLILPSQLLVLMDHGVLSAHGIASMRLELDWTGGVKTNVEITIMKEVNK